VEVVVVKRAALDVEEVRRAVLATVVAVLVNIIVLREFLIFNSFTLIDESDTEKF
jgi:hypothetical protein